MSYLNLSPPKLKVYESWICLRSSTCVVQTRNIHVNSRRFQISNFEATQIKYQVWCAARLHPLRKLKPAAKTPHASQLQALACQRHYDIASTFCARSVWSGFWHLSCSKCGKRLGNHTGINRKSSWVQKEIVSQGQEQPKSLQSRWQFQMSHIEVCPSSGFCSFTGTHTLSLAEMLRLACGRSCSSSKVTTAFISFSL